MVSGIQFLTGRNNPESGAVLWRYMDLPKYLDLMRTSQLFLAPLPSMEDPWEGAVGSESRSVESNRLRDQRIPPQRASEWLDQAERISESDRGRAYINCWHCSEVESAAMWRLYAERDAGIAIKSTWSNLLTSIKDPENLYAIPVEYRDQSISTTDFSNLALYTSKRLSFKYEEEVRLIRYDPLDPVRKMTQEELASQPPIEERQDKVSYDTVIDPSLRPKFYRYDVDLYKLALSVTLAPQTPLWIEDIVRDVTRKYDVNVPIARSVLEEIPEYLRYQFQIN